MLCIKGFTKTKMRRSTCRQPGTKSAPSPGNQPLTIRLSTGDFVPAFGLHTISLVRISSRTCFAWKGFTETKRRRSTGQQQGRKSAVRPSDKPVTNHLSIGDFVPAFGLHRISLVRASEEMFRIVVFDALEDTNNGCALHGETRRRPILLGPPCPATLLCAARPDPPVVCPGFGLDR